MVSEAYSQGSVTLGKVVASFEEEVAAFTRVQHAVAVSSCTAGLMLAFAALEIPDGAEVVVPSFTFAATVQSLMWNRLTPVFVDCDPGTLTIDPIEVERSLGTKTRAICPVTIYGLPPNMDELEALSEKHGIPLVCDSAQGLGSSYRGKPAGGFGLCEIFSLSPTKVITAVEGGLITTNDARLADKLRLMRDYGKGLDDQGMIYNGLSARMSELHAAVGLLSLRNADSLIGARHRLIDGYRDFAAQFPGCRVQELPEDRVSSGNYFALLIGEDARADIRTVFDALAQHNIRGKRYFYPPVHVQKAFQGSPYRVVGDLPNTCRASEEALALPLYSHMTADEQGRVCEVLREVLAG